jgi:hypothetical protein
VSETTRNSILPWISSSDEVLLRIHAQVEHLVSLRLPTPLAAWTPRLQDLRELIQVAFWSSLLRNEERPTRVRIALAPRDLVPDAFALASAVDYHEAQVAKLAHVVPPYGTLLVCSEDEKLKIWGFRHCLVEESMG